MEQIASLVAPVATTVAAFIVAANLGSRITGYGFVIFTLGSLSWTLLGYVTDQPNLLWQNVVLTGLNLFGIWRWLGRQAQVEDGAHSAAQASRQSPGESLFPVSLLLRAEVCAKDGSVGQGVEAMAGCESGRLSYVVVSNGGVAGVGETLRRVPWSGARVEQDRVVLPMTERDFGRLEEIARDEWPAR